jgi:pseudaminic acid synthase
MAQVIEIAGHKIGKGHPPFVIAEVSANHNGELERALALLDVAKASGAHAVKLQTYRADTITIDCDKEDFKIKEGPWAGRQLYDLYDEAHTPWEWHEALFERAKQLGLICFSSPFDDSAVDFLENLGVPAYKVASFELLDLPLIRKMARTQKPIIMSTGMADLSEIAKAVKAVQSEGNNQIILLHCVSAYPASCDEANLKTIVHLSEAFDIPVGLSDHTLGVAVSVAAVALGACVIEKHFTMKRSDGGPDGAFSLEPEELSELVEASFQAWQAVGSVNYKHTSGEEKNAIFRRSLYVVKDIPIGQVLSKENVRSIRPGFGLAPEFFDDVLGRKARVNIEKGTALQWDIIE